MNDKLRWSGVLTLIALAACSKPTTLQSANTSSAIRSAEVSGADALPKASYHLQLAKEELDAAQQFDRDGDAPRAAGMLARSEADAELALLLSHEQSEKDEADAAIQRVAAFRRSE